MGDFESHEKELRQIESSGRDAWDRLRDECKEASSTTIIASLSAHLSTQGRAHRASVDAQQRARAAQSRLIVADELVKSLQGWLLEAIGRESLEAEGNIDG